MSYYPNNPNGQATSANSAPVVIASDQSALSTNVLSLPPIPAGSSVIGAVTQSGGPWTSNLTQVGGAALTLGQALAASSLPVVLTAAQLATLTPLSTVAVTQSGTWSVGVNNFPATQPVSGTVAVSSIASALPPGSNTIGAVTQASGPWTVTGTGTAGSPAAGIVTIQGNASGTPIPISGSITATNLSIGPTGSTSPADATYIGALASTSAPTLITGNMYPPSLTLSGALRVDGSAVTQPISATSLPLPTGAATKAALTTINTTLGSPFQAGGSIGNTSFGATQSGTWNVGLNAGSNAIGSVSVSNFPASQPVSGTVTVTQATGTNLHTVVDSGTVTATISGTPTVSVSNFPATQPVSGTVTANAGTGTFAVSATSLPLPIGAATAANQATEISSLASIVTNTTGIAQGSTTSGQTGELQFGAVTTAAPTYTTGQSSPLSLKTTGELRVDSATADAYLAAIATNTGSAIPVGTNTIGGITNSALATSGTIAGNGNVLQLPNGGSIPTLAPYSGITLEISGTWSSTLTLVGSNGGSYYTVDVINLSNPNNGPQSTITANGLYYAPVNFVNLELVSSGYVSGTVNCYAQFKGISSQIIGSDQITGNVASGTEDSGNGVKVSAVSDALYGLPTVSSGNRVDMQADLKGRLYIAPDANKATFSAAFSGAVTATTPTDVFTVYGSSSKKVTITRVGFSGTLTTAAYQTTVLLKRTATNTGGTSAAVTACQHDSASAAATATALSYTANPSALGAGVAFRTVHWFLDATGTGQLTNQQEFILNQNGSKGIILNSASEGLAINMQSTTITGNNLSIWVEWTEE